MHMKNARLYRATGFVLLLIIASSSILLFKSCELQNDCMMCKKVTYENGVKISETTPVKYCDEALDKILDEEDVTIGNRTVRWECN